MDNNTIFALVNVVIVCIVLVLRPIKHARKPAHSGTVYHSVQHAFVCDVGFVLADNTADAAMTEGPWYACRKVPTVHHTMGGIRVNVESEACNADGEPIPGLYAAGECTGGIHGENRLGGNAIADCMTFGRNAGTNAAKYALA